MPEAFCGLETLVEKFCYICALCERKKYPPLEKKIPSVRKRTPLHARKDSLRNRDVKK